VGFKSEEMNSQVKNYKGMVLEIVAKTHKKISVPTYKMSGQCHNPTFTSIVVYEGKVFSGNGTNKKEADQACYRNIYQEMISVPSRHVSRETMWDTENVDIYSVDWEAPPGRKYTISRSPPPPNYVQRIPVQVKRPEVSFPYPIKPPQNYYEEEDPDELVYYDHEFFQRRNSASTEEERIHFLPLAKFIKMNICQDPAFATDFNAQFRTFVQTSDCEAIAHWIATAHKEGGFNPYGNGQTSAQFILTKPSFKNIGQQWMCSSTCYCQILLIF
jgi:hypothetical protein